MSLDLDLDAALAQLEAQLADPAQPQAEVPTAVQEPCDGAQEATPTPSSDIRLSIRGGADAKPIEISDTGVLAETTSRLRPDGAVELILQIDGVRRFVKATVVRSVVHSLGPTIFRTAFKFDEPTTLSEQK